MHKATRVLICFISAALFAASGPDNIIKEVRHELLTLPNYTVFDQLGFQVNGANVTLTGSVVNPNLKRDAEAAVKKIEGVMRIDNQIEVLPSPPNDVRLRQAVYRAVFGKLESYQFMAMSVIHIIVKNGNVTLVGTVDNATDKSRAELAAKGVFDVKSLADNLEIGK